MKVSRVRVNNRKKAFEVQIDGRGFSFPFAHLEVRPGPEDRITEVHVDEEIGGEGFSCRLASGAEGTVHGEQVLEYNEDPNYLADLLLYRLTLEARRRVEASALSKRELIRRLGMSPSQLYRLLDTTNDTKSLNRLISLFRVLGYTVRLQLIAQDGAVKAELTADTGEATNPAHGGARTA